MLLFSGKPYKGIIILELVVKICIFMHMVMTTFQIYLLFTIAIGMRFIVLNLICILPQQCALYCYYQHTKFKTTKTRKRLPLAGFINIMISTFIMIQCSFAGFKRNLFHIPGFQHASTQSAASRTTGLSTPPHPLLSLLPLLTCLAFMFFWTVTYFYFDQYEAFNYAQDQVDYLEERQKSELARAKEEMRKLDARNSQKNGAKHTNGHTGPADDDIIVHKAPLSESGSGVVNRRKKDSKKVAASEHQAHNPELTQNPNPILDSSSHSQALPSELDIDIKSPSLASSDK